MAQTRNSFFPIPGGRVAIVLVLIGFAGLFHHLTSKPDMAADASTTGRTPGPYIAPVVALPRGAGKMLSGSEELKEMRRRLREFIIPRPDIKTLTVPDALALLENHWLTLPHDTDQVPPASFTLDQGALKHVTANHPPMLVTLEIPGVSLLTNLNLLAAQAGLQSVVTKSGAVLEVIGRPTGDPVQSGTTVLSNETINQFLQKAYRNVGGGQIIFDTDEIPKYGIPIETTAINSEGKTESIILTDSKIHPLSDNRQRGLEKLFRPMGLSQLGDRPDYAWSALDGTLTANGSGRTLRIAAAVTAALEEAAHSGVQLELLAADWNGQKPPALPETKAPGKRSWSVSPALSSASKKPLPSTPANLRLRFDREAFTRVPPPPTRPYLVFPEPGDHVNVSVGATGSRFIADLNITIKTPPNMLLPPGAKKAPDFTKSFPGTVCRHGEWTRLDFPLHEAEPDGAKQSLFLRVSRKTLGKEE